MPDRSACEAMVRQLWPFVDDVLTDDERAGIVDHLSGCAACTSHVDFARAFLAAVASARPQLDAHAELRGRVLHALASEGFSLS